MGTFRQSLTSRAILIAALAFVSTASAIPDDLTGSGCSAYGVAETVPKHPMDVKFFPIYVSGWKIYKLCGKNRRGLVQGCYFPDGTAYLANKSDKLYWHEWCHAKFGARHINPKYARFIKPQAPTRLTQNNRSSESVPISR